MLGLLLACVGIFFMSQTFIKVRKKIFSEKESFFWMIGAIGIIFSHFLIPIFDDIAKWVGVDYPPTLAFVTLFIFSFILIFRITQLSSIQNDRIKELAYRIALLEKEERRYEKKL